MSRDATVVLPDGRRLGYAEWGDPDGAPVFAFHGGGMSRLDRPTDEDALRGVRFITVDRPGHGLSDVQPGRRLLDWPVDVAALADALGIRRFAVYGMSGGGPYAAACAYVLADRVSRAALVSTSLQGDALPQVSLEQMEMAFTAMWPGVVDAMASGPEQGMAAWMSVAGNADACDIEVMSRPHEFAVGAEALIEGARQGPGGVAYDLAMLMTQPWGFDPAGITIDVDVWHGELDRIVAVEEAHRTAATIPRAHLEICPGAGHFLAADRMEAILARLCSGGDVSR